MAEKLLLVKDVARELKVNSNFVYVLMKQGELPYLKLGSKKVRQSDLDAFMERMVGKEAMLRGDKVEIKDLED